MDRGQLNETCAAQGSVLCGVNACSQVETLKYGLGPGLFHGVMAVLVLTDDDQPMDAQGQTLPGSQ